VSGITCQNPPFQGVPDASLFGFSILPLSLQGPRNFSPPWKLRSFPLLFPPSMKSFFPPPQRLTTRRLHQVHPPALPPWVPKIILPKTSPPAVKRLWLRTPGHSLLRVQTSQILSRIPQKPFYPHVVFPFKTTQGPDLVTFEKEGVFTMGTCRLPNSLLLALKTFFCQLSPALCGRHPWLGVRFTPRKNLFLPPQGSFFPFAYGSLEQLFAITRECFFFFRRPGPLPPRYAKTVTNLFPNPLYPSGSVLFVHSSLHYLTPPPPQITVSPVPLPANRYEFGFSMYFDYLFQQV